MSREERHLAFRKDTSKALHECARWLDEHAEDLAGRFVGDDVGCKTWAIGFSFDTDRWPDVMVDVSDSGISFVEGSYTKQQVQ